MSDSASDHVDRETRQSMLERITRLETLLDTMRQETKEEHVERMRMHIENKQILDRITLQLHDYDLVFRFTKWVLGISISAVILQVITLVRSAHLR